MILMKLDLLDGSMIEVVVADSLTADRLRRFENDADVAFCDHERWLKMRKLMTHEHCGPNVGWTLGIVLEGDDPDDAIDKAEVPT